MKSVWLTILLYVLPMSIAAECCGLDISLVLEANFPNHLLSIKQCERSETCHEGIFHLTSALIHTRKNNQDSAIYHFRLAETLSKDADFRAKSLYLYAKALEKFGDFLVASGLPVKYRYISP